MGAGGWLLVIGNWLVATGYWLESVEIGDG
jgi:hypothetical protein